MKSNVVSKAVVVGLVAVLNTGCATIISKSKYPVIINSEPSEAQVQIATEDGNIVFEGKTPVIATLPAGESYFDRKSYTVTASKSTFQTASAPIESSMNGWYWGNILFGGIIGMLIVDPISGSMYEIDTTEVHIPLSPAASAEAIDDATVKNSPLLPAVTAIK